MPRTLSRIAVVLTFAAAGCGAILGFPDDGSSTGGGTGGAGTGSTTSTTTTTSTAATTGTGGGTPTCQEGAPCYQGLDGTEGVGACKAGATSCEGGVVTCDDVRPALQTCGAPQGDENCDGLPGCTGHFRWAQGGLAATATNLAAGLDGAVAVVGTSTAKAGSALVATFDARGRPCWSAPTLVGTGGTLTPVGVALSGVERTLDTRLTQVICHGGAGAGTDLAASTVVTGTASGKVDFGQGPKQSAVGTDAFVTMLNPGGKVAWGMLIGSAGNDLGGGVAVGPAGAIYVTGMAEGPLTLPGCPATSGGAPTSPVAFVARLAPDGTCAWIRTFGTGMPATGAAGTDVAIDGAGNVVLVGRFTGKLNLGGTMLSAGPTWSNNTFVVEMGSADGAVLGAPVALDVLNVSPDPKVVVGPGNDVFVAGTFTGAWGGCLDNLMKHQGYLVRLDASLKPDPPLCYYSVGVDVTANGLAVDGAGNVVIALSSAAPVPPVYQQPTNFTSGAITAGGVMAVKYGGAYADYLWAAPFAPGTASGAGIGVDGMGNVVLAGNPTAAIDLGGATVPANHAFVLELAP